MNPSLLNSDTANAHVNYFSFISAVFLYVLKSSKCQLKEEPSDKMDKIF